MIIDSGEVPDASALEADVCVVGSGPAGLALALRLARTSSREIIVLESGGLAFEEAAQSLAGGDVVGQRYFPLIETRIRAFGGSTLSWAGQCAMIDSDTFDARPWLPGARWPFQPTALAPYYEEAFDLCGIGPAARAAADRDVAERLRRDPFASDDLTVSPIHLSRPLRFGYAYRSQFQAARNIRVYLHATATEVGLDPDGAGASEITVVAAGGRRFVARAKQFVLAGGGIENARLLLASRRLDPRGIGNRHDLVGRFLMEHPRVVTRYRARPGKTPLRRALKRGAGRLIRASLSSAAQEREGLLGYRATLALASLGEPTGYSEAVRRVVLAFMPPWNESPYSQDVGGGPMGVRPRDVRTVLRRPHEGLGMAALWLRGWLGNERFLQIESVVEQRPEHANRVELADERDGVGMPRARLRWTVGELEARTYRRSLATVLRHLERLEPGIAGRVVEETDPWPARLLGSWHHIGTTKMAEDPHEGVVDPSCRVHGLRNLYVAGSSVFPASGSVPPTLTIVMLALRLAGHLADRL